MFDGLTTGRVVHYSNDGDTCQAGIIAHVWNKDTGCVNVVVCTGDEEKPVKLVKSVMPSEDRAVLRSWHWPERA